MFLKKKKFIFCIVHGAGEQLLLLEYVPNKSLFDRMHTFHGQSSGILTWSNRLSIALDIAEAVKYLHSRAEYFGSRSGEKKMTLGFGSTIWILNLKMMQI